MNHFKNTFIKGLITILPLVITCYVLYWFIGTAEQMAKEAFNALFPNTNYAPGLGLVAALGLVYGIGLAMNAWLGRAIVSIGEKALRRVPLIKTIYGSVKDLLNYFDTTNEDNLGSPVVVEFKNLGIEMIGFVTKENIDREINSFSSNEDETSVAVYLPMSYQIGGFMIVLPKSEITPLDMSIEEAMKLCVTAGMSSKPENS